MKIKFTLMAIAALMFMTAPVQILAQEEEEEQGSVFSVSTYQWPFNNLDDIMELMAEDQDLVEQNEFILSQRILTHGWAGDFSVMFIIEYASFEDISKASDRGDELYEAKYPDEEAREARNDKFTALGGGMHIDNIVIENPALTK